jgi:hypothetical protein
MDPAITTLAASVVSLLAPYLKKAAEGAAQSAGSAALAAARRIYELIRSRIAASTANDGSLHALQETPDDPNAQAALRTQIETLASSDDTLRRELIRLLHDARDSGVDPVFNTNITGDVQKLVQIGVVHGNVTI